MPKLKARAKAPPKPQLGLTTKQRVKKYMPFYIMFIPLLICMIVFAYLPMFGILYAFTDYTPFKPATFVGLKNFQTLFSQPGFWQAFFNTLQISTTKLILSTLGSVILALLMDELRKGLFRKTAQTTYVFPVSETRTMITAEMTTTRDNILARVVMGQMTPEDGMAEYKAAAERLGVDKALAEMNGN